MTRQQAYQLIDKERTDQDTVWRTGRASEQQYKFAAPHVLLLEEKLVQLRTNWYKSRKEDLQNDLIKMAAIAIRALEEIE